MPLERVSTVAALNSLIPTPSERQALAHFVSNFDFRKSEEGIKLVRYVGTGSGILFLPAGFFGSKICSLGPRSLAEHEELLELFVPEGVTTIEDEAFADCKNLERVHLPNTLATLGRGVFKGCTSLREVRRPAL